MTYQLWELLRIVIMILLFAVIFISVSHLLHGLLPARRIWPLERIRDMLFRKRKYRVLRSLFLVPRQESDLEELRSLLASCGWSMDAVNYTAWKRLVIAVSIIALVAIYVISEIGWTSGKFLLWMTLVSAVLLVLAASDRIILRAVLEQRRAKIVQDVHVISAQLLYYRRSGLNLHGQLQRCLPLAMYIRKELQLLVNEWYEGPGEAIRKFRFRLATDEAIEFAETLLALHQYGSERYYELLEKRIRSYKEKLALVRESRKEASSYVLFLLSGIPIIYTFLIFIYPWVAESRYLFDSLS